jgi:hypothetical protein
MLSWIVLLSGIIIGTANCSLITTSNIKTPIENKHRDIRFNKHVKINKLENIYDTGSQGYAEEFIFEVSNLTNRKIQFPPDWGIHVYAFNPDKHEWIKLEDKFTVASDHPLLLLPKSHKEYYEGTFDINPIIGSNLREFVTLKIRVIIIGKIVGLDGGTEEKVGAYYNFKMRP